MRKTALNLILLSCLFGAWATNLAPINSTDKKTNKTSSITTTTTVAAPVDTPEVTTMTESPTVVDIQEQSTEATHISIFNSPTVDRGGAILTATEFELFVKSLTYIQNDKCRNDLNATLHGILAAEPWAVAMYDATAKTAFGIESGILHQFGHFDECLQQNQPTAEAFNADMPVRAKYCLTDVALNGLEVHNIDTRQPKPTNYTLLAHWGACVPATCSANDVAMHLQVLLQRPVTVAEQMCQLRENEVHISRGMFSYAAVIFCFIFLSALSTIYHGYLIYRAKQGETTVSKTSAKREMLSIALLSFSIIENTKKLFKASKDHLGLNCINGIKALSMLFILAGHALSFIYGAPLYNAEFINSNIKLTIFAFFPNSLLFVDIFLLLSGFLFCRILLIELERRRGKVNALVLYVGRYIRLTPSYLAVIAFYMTWFPNVGSGPLWKQRIELEQGRCTSSWWLNILYVNNYFNTDKLCMFQSWYLSVDTQLFILAPIFIYLLYKTRKYGMRLLVLTVVITSLVPFVITYMKKLDPTLIIYFEEIKDLASNAFYIGSYIKTHMRASAYAVGLLTGYLVHLMQEKGTKLPKLWVRVAWLAAVVMGSASMFGVNRFYGQSFTTLESSMYSGFHKLGWNISVAWLVLATTTGHGGFLQRFLSSHFFVPISRLTYCAYLCNGVVELYHAASLRSSPYISYIPLLNEVLAHIFDTFVLAFVLCLLFESPIHALERILLRGARKNNQEKAKQNAESRTPSTSEERV